MEPPAALQRDDDSAEVAREFSLTEKATSVTRAGSIRSEISENRRSSLTILERASQLAEELQCRSAKCPHMKRALKQRGASVAMDSPNQHDIWRYRVHLLLQSQRFDAGVGSVIFVNSIAVGWESEVDLRHGDLTPFQILEQFFLVFYMLELSLRVFAHRWQCLDSWWVRFDVLLVLSGVLSCWVVQPMTNGYSSSGDGAGVADHVEFLVVIRMLRLLRLARALRLLVQFRTLWKMIRGLFSSASTMMYTFIIVTLLLYVFSCAAVELITKNRRSDPMDAMFDPVWADVVDEYYKDIPDTMVTLIQFVVLDSIRESYIPLVRRDFTTLFFYIAFMLVVSISMMNLVTAVIVEVSLEQAKLDHEAERIAQVAAVIPELKREFHDIDSDGSGTISMEEIDGADDSTRDMLMKLVRADNLQELFDMLDVDGSGEVDIDEFCEGIVRVVTSTEPVEFIRILKQLSIARHEVLIVQDMVRDLQNLLFSNGNCGSASTFKADVAAPEEPSITRTTAGGAWLQEMKEMHQSVLESVERLSGQVAEMKDESLPSMRCRNLGGKACPDGAATQSAFAQAVSERLAHLATELVVEANEMLAELPGASSLPRPFCRMLAGRPGAGAGAVPSPGLLSSATWVVPAAVEAAKKGCCCCGSDSGACCANPASLSNRDTPICGWAVGTEVAPPPTVIHVARVGKAGL